MAFAPVGSSSFVAPPPPQVKPQAQAQKPATPPAVKSATPQDTFVAAKPAQAGGTGPVPPPTDPGNRGEAGNLWQDINVSAAQAMVPQSPPGQGQKVAVLDYSFANPGDHGVYVGNIIGGHAGTALPGIAAGAQGTGVNWDQRPPNLGAAIGMGWGMLTAGMAPSNLANNLNSNMAANAPGTIETAYQQTNNGVVALTSMGFVSTPDQAVAILNEVKSITDRGGTVVLASNTFPASVASDPSVQQALANSGAIVTTPIMRDANGDGVAGDYATPVNNVNGQESTFPTSQVDVAVPTTNGNNSVAVPAMAGTVALMRQVHPGITSAQIKAILQDPANFASFTLRDGEQVPVLDAQKAVQAAQSLP